MISSNPDIAEKAVTDGSLFYPQPKLAKISKTIIKYGYNIFFTKTACKIQMFLLKFSNKRNVTDIQKEIYIKYIPVLKKETLYIYDYIYSFISVEINNSKTDIRNAIC